MGIDSEDQRACLGWNVLAAVERRAILFVPVAVAAEGEAEVKCRLGKVGLQQTI